MITLPPRARMLSLLFLVAILCVTAHATDISATATYTDTLVSPGVYDYSITLNDTGTTTMGTFWFSWIPGTGFLSATPTDITSPTGWTETLKGHRRQDRHPMDHHDRRSRPWVVADRLQL